MKTSTTTAESSPRTRYDVGAETEQYAPSGDAFVSPKLEPLQLTLDDELADDLDFGAWVESLPIDLEAA
jgi:hypothetical protein